MATSSFDTGDFARNLNRAAEQQANEALRQVANNAQAKVDAVQRDHTGDPVETIIPVLRAALADLELTGGDDDFMAWAKVIAGGGRVFIKPERVRI
jgi:hypothetical protein